MKKKGKYLMAFFAILILAISGCSSTNKYMVRDTDEYNKVTRKFVGGWTVTDYADSSTKYLGRTYEKVTAKFDFNSRMATFTYYISEAKISEKLVDWKEKYPDLKVDEYKVVLTSQWKISDKGEILYLDEQDPNIIIKGSGDNFEGFYGWERSKFEAGKNVGKDGGLAGMVMNKVAQSATGTSDLLPKLPSQFNFEFNKDGNNLRIYSASKMNIKLSKLK
ncbi:MAG: hypothetical protein ACQERZ_07630 [Fusobacteriota bacterium]